MVDDLGTLEGVEEIKACLFRGDHLRGAILVLSSPATISAPEPMAEDVKLVNVQYY